MEPPTEARCEPSVSSATGLELADVCERVRCARLSEGLPPDQLADIMRFVQMQLCSGEECC